jgi:hypothetical protein
MGILFSAPELIEYTFCKICDKDFDQKLKHCDLCHYYDNNNVIIHKCKMCNLCHSISIDHGCKTEYCQICKICTSTCNIHCEKCNTCHGTSYKQCQKCNICIDRHKYNSHTKTICTKQYCNI